MKIEIPNGSYHKKTSSELKRFFYEAINFCKTVIDCRLVLRHRRHDPAAT